MKTLKYTALLATLALALPLSLFAREKNAHTVTIGDPVQLSGTQLKPGDYKVEWQGTGSAVQVTFMQQGKTVATAPGTLKMNDTDVKQDGIVTENTGTNARTLKEIDFGHQKEALVFEQSGM